MASLGEQTVRDLASRNPAAARIFEKFGIDYCCGGERSLAQACSAAKVSIREVADALEAPPSPQREDRDWQNGSLSWPSTLWKGITGLLGRKFSA